MDRHARQGVRSVSGLISHRGLLLNAASSVAGDPLWSDVALCINGVGSIYDAKGHAVTNTGGVSVVTTDPDFPFGAMRITGGNYLSLADSTDFDTPGPFTLEFDYKSFSRPTIYPPIISAYNTFGVNGGYAIFDRHQSSAANYAIAVNGSFPQLTYGASDGVKRRFRYVRSSTQVRLYIDDIFIVALGLTVPLGPVGGVWIGTAGDSIGSMYVDALIGRIRLTRAARTGPQGTDPYPEF